MHLENNLNSNLLVVKYGTLKQSSGNGICSRCKRTNLNSYTEYNNVKLCEFCLNKLTKYINREINLVPSVPSYNNDVEYPPEIILMTMLNPIYIDDPNIIIKVDDKIITVIKKSVLVRLKKMLEQLEKSPSPALRELYESEVIAEARKIFLMNTFPPKSMDPEFLDKLVKAFKPACNEIAMDKYQKYKAKYLEVTNRQ
jgi:hypothetical protein